ncbi:MAG: hypothetical protein QOH51_1916 [Acidobacteriota bacterium]|nr:hypothetical protein [Acidobacteriota bacterium]
MNEEGHPETMQTPTDPSLEFDVFETIRLRLAETLMRRGYDLVEAERIALYVVEGARPMSHFLKALTRVSPPEDDEVIIALDHVLAETPALAKAKRLRQRVDTSDPD